MSTISNLGTSNLATSYKTLASGKRLTAAEVDPAALAVSESLDASTRGLAVATQNVHNGISVSQVASGAVSGVSDSVKRMRSLAVQASSGTLSAGGRAAIQKEFQAISEEINRVAGSTAFGGIALADGSSAGVRVQAGEGAGDGFDLPLADLRTSSLGLDGLDLSSAGGAAGALSAMDLAQTNLQRQSSEMGASQVRMEAALGGLTASSEATTAAYSRIADADYGQASADLATSKLQTDISVAVQAHRKLSQTSVLGLL